MTATDEPILIIGSFISPYVRKVLACLNLKGLDYTIDPITPFFGNDDFARLSPLRRIPVLVKGDMALCDSSVICAWLDEEYPDAHPLMPATPADRAQARWLEEYADTRMGDVFIWNLFFQRVVHPFVWREPGDQARIDAAVNVNIPEILDYLEGVVPGEGFLFGPIGLADVAIATFFPNARYAGVEVDAARWPLTAAYVARCLAHPAFVALAPLEQIQIGVKFTEQRAAMIAAGARLSEVTYAQREPRKGLMEL